MKPARFFALAFLILIFAFSTLSYSGVPQMINYQGKITTPTGALIDTTVGMIFTIYDDSTTGTVLWADTQSTVVVEKGIFSVLLGSVNPIPDSVFPGDVRYLGVKIGADPEMTPRKSIVSIAYAYKSEYADTAEYAKVAVSDGDWTISGNNVYRLTGNVGIGTTNPTASLEIEVANPYLLLNTTDYNQDLTLYFRSIYTGGIANIHSTKRLDIYGGGGGGGTYTMSINDGKVGIGTTSPLYSLHVFGDIGFTGTLQQGIVPWARLTNVPPGLNDGDDVLSEEQVEDYVGGMVTGNTETDITVTYQDTDGTLDFVVTDMRPTAGNDIDVTGTEVKVEDDIDVSVVRATGASGLKLYDDASNLGAFIKDGGNVGIGTTSPAQKLDVMGTVQMIGFKLLTGAGAGKVLTSDGSGVGTWQVAPGGIGGSGTINFIPKFTGSNTLGNSIIYETGGNLGIGTTLPGYKLHVNGTFYANYVNTAGLGNNLLYPMNQPVQTTDSPTFYRVYLDDYGTALGGFHVGGTSNPGIDNLIVDGKVGLGITTPNEQLEITGNLRLPTTTSTAGIIKAGANRFIHNYGTRNTFVGVNAGNFTMTGNANAANGYYALNANNGYQNTANGCYALYKNTSGSYNTANGWSALGSNTSGSNNTANGMEALYFNTAYRNTATGYRALYSNTTGYNNTALGYQADVTSGSFTNATAIGYNAAVNASNKVRIGNTSVTSIGGQVGWTTFSDGRYKKSFSENVPGLAFISKLKPVTYTMDVDAIDAALNPARNPHEGQSEEDFKPSTEDIASKQAQSQIVYTGFIAQEVEEAAKETGYSFSGLDAPKNDNDLYGLRYAEFVVPLVKAVQEQQAQIQKQQEEIRELKQRIEELEKK